MPVLDAARIEARIGDFRADEQGAKATRPEATVAPAQKGQPGGEAQAASDGTFSAATAGEDGLAAFPAFSVQCLDATPSTNTVVKDALRAGAAEGLVCAALEQRDGHGRQGRAWASPVGGAYFSLLLRPRVAPNELPTLSLAASLAVRAALLRLGCPHDVRIKWPNDVVCAAGKLCGISLEAVAGGVCVGIGVNALRPAGGVAPVGGKNTPAFAFPDEPAVGFGGVTARQAHLLEDVVACTLASFAPAYARWQAEGFPAFRDEYNALLSLRGATVEATSITGDVLAGGVVERVDDAGRLLLRQADGALFAASSGEIHLSRVSRRP